LRGSIRAVIASLALTSALVIALVAAASASPGRPLVTALAEPNEFPNAQQDTAFARASKAGTTRVVLVLLWREVAPGGSTKPSFDATDPASPLYNWRWFDPQVRLAKENGLDIVVEIHEAPEWAQGEGSGRSGSIRPHPGEFGMFATAAAKRYSGTFDPLDGRGPLPRIRFWQAWNEPNLAYFLSPSFDANGRAVSPGHYLRMLNNFAAAIHRVNGTNVVIAGGTAPFATTSVKPLRFMRTMLCLTRALTVNR
jgi:hypothetical protein